MPKRKSFYFRTWSGFFRVAQEIMASLFATWNQIKQLKTLAYFNSEIKQHEGWFKAPTDRQKVVKHLNASPYPQMVMMYLT